MDGIYRRHSGRIGSPNLPPERRATHSGRQAAQQASTIRDRELVVRLLSGEASAAEEFAAQFGCAARSALRSSGIPADEIDDISQTVFLEFWRNGCHRLRAWRGEATLRSYISLIVKREAFTYIRRQKSFAAALPPLFGASSDDEDSNASVIANAVDPNPGPEEQVLVDETQTLLARALRSIATRDADLIRRKHLRGQSYKEIALDLGMTTSHVGVALGRAEERLRKCLAS